jgi:hypothetical protein
MSHEKDRKIVDSGWGIKPDDQPANAADAGAAAIKTYRYRPDEPDAIRKILQAQRRGFNTANRVRVEAERTIIIDINKDEFTVEGLGYGDARLLEMLGALGAACDPQELSRLDKSAKPREFSLSKVWAWGAERTG